ncbi:family 43 glycosylhydrolase [Cystobacter fuscus]|uniref:family 43 glycosylhydrolase n=1 Tax=Cystobacter fuscus TaxID=43 RepID=UPI002B2E7653|nr:family 43 glycosylhydrolase [Cystobacter fuscus]
MGALLPVLALLTITACPSEPTPPNPPEPPGSEPPLPPAPTPVSRVFTNPLRASIPGGGFVETCADPTLIRGQGSDTSWYMLCTSDPLNEQDRDSSGRYKHHLLPILKSQDLVNWAYVGDALTRLPDWAKPGAGIWAPEIAWFNDKFYLYFTVTDTPEGGSAIGVATSDSPTGPWTISNKPVVEPHENVCCGNSRRHVYDPEVLVTPGGKRYIYYGSYYGGISVRELSEDGLTSDKYTQVEVATPNRYEAPNVIQHGEYYYLLASAAECCRGALTGYSVFAGRSKQPYGPFVDREGVRLTYNRVGGTPVLGANGNRWVGVGHHSVFTDTGGQDWIVYHGIDRHSPYVSSTPGGGDLLNKRPVLMDALDWVDGWPVTRGGQGPSDSEQPAPAAQANEKSRYEPVFAKQDLPGAELTAFSDEFNGSSLDPKWSWTRPPVMSDYGVEQGQFRFNTRNKDIYQGDNAAAVLWQPAPTGNFLVETKMSLNLPPVSCCHNFVQAGIMIQKDDDNYVRLTHVSFYETRQIAFSKEVSLEQVPVGAPLFGDTYGGPADETVWMRIVRRVQGSEELYTAYSSRDGTTWTRTATWTHALGAAPRLGLLSIGGEGFVATFDYVRVYELKQ